MKDGSLGEVFEEFPINLDFAQIVKKKKVFFAEETTLCCCLSHHADHKPIQTAKQP